MNTPPRIDVIAWVNQHFGQAGLLDYNSLRPILCFPLLWSLFEKEACGNDCHPASIQKVVGRAEKSGWLQQDSYEPFLKYFQDHYLTNGQTMAVFFDHFAFARKNPPSPAELASMGIVERALTGVSPELKDTVGALLLIAYRIRNNLFHGTKWVQSLPSQSGLFEVVNSLLVRFMEDIRKL